MERILRPEKVYVTEEVYHSSNCVERLGRMMSSIKPSDPPQRVTDAQLNEIARGRGWESYGRWGTKEDPSDPDLVFTTAKFHTPQEREERREKYPNLRFRDLLGYLCCSLRTDGSVEFKERTRGIICQSAWQLYGISGCAFMCDYCGFGGVNKIFLNIEEYLEHIEDWLALDPKQMVYKWDNQTDVNIYEPEWGWTEALVRYFGQRKKPEGQNDKYFLIYTGKSANVNFLLDLPHNGHAIIQWSTAARTQCTLIEKKTAPMEARIEAAAKCQEAGYIVRHRLSPIIPVKNWREENREMIDLIFKTHQPDVISLCSFGWMNFTSMKSCMNLDLIDPQFVRAMEAMEPFLTERGYSSGGGHPIPHDARLIMLEFLVDEIRKRSPNCVISLCLETPEMWSVLGKKIDQVPSNYVCNCGPYSAPGAPLYERLVGTVAG